MSEVVIAPELDYKIKSLSHSSYQLTQIFQQIGLPTVTLGSSGGPDSIFQIPDCAFNLSESMLNFTLTPPVTTGANNANWVYVNCIAPIRQLQLYTDQGLYLADLYDVGNYTNMIFKYETKNEDLQTTPSLFNNVADPTGFEGLMPCGVIANSPLNTIVAATNSFKLARPTPWANTLGGNTVGYGINSYSESAYVLPGSKADASPTPVINFKIPMRKLKNTIFGLDKTLCFGRILYLRVVWQATGKIGYQSVSTGTAAGNAVPQLNPQWYTDTNIVGTPTAWAGNVSISNLYFYLAKEQNIVIESELRRKMSSPEGFKLMVPWVSQFKQNIPASQLNNLTMRFTNALGRRLLKIYWAPYNASESTCYAYDHNALYTVDNGVANGQASDRQKVNSFYTLVNNTRTSQYNYSVNAGYNTDYDARKDKLKGSSVLSQNEYYYDFVWCEDFTGNESMTDTPSDQAPYVDGLDISNGEVKYDIFVTQGGNGNYVNVNMYVYAVTLKEMVINSSGISLF